MNASADFSALVAKSIRMQDMVFASFGQNITIAVGRASLAELAKYFSKPAAARPFEIYMAEKIYRPEDDQRTGVPLIEAGVLVTPDKAVKYQEQFTALDIVLCQNGTEFNDRILERAISAIQEERAKQTRTAQEKAEQISKDALEAYKLLKQILDSLTGVESPIKERMLDPRVMGSLRMLNGVITRVYGAIHEAAEDLLDGKGRIIASLRGIHPPSDKEAEIALKTATSAMMCGYNMRLFDTSGLAKLFLAGLLLNCFNWGGRKVPSGHEENSAGIVEAMREQGCDLPEGLEDLVRVHSNRELVGRNVYEVVLNAESTHTDESETGIGKTFLVDRDRAGLESRITQEHNRSLGFGTGVSNLAGAGIKNLRLEVRMLNEAGHAAVIILALVEEFYERTDGERPEPPHAVMESMLSRTGYSVLDGSEQVHDVSHTMFAKVLIALANTFRILFVGMMVEITDTGIVHKAIRQQVGVGCRGVVIAVDGYLGPVIDICILGDTQLPWPEKGLGEMQPAEFVNIRMNEKKGVPYRFLIPLGVSAKRRVFSKMISCVGIVSAKTFGNFQHIVERHVPVIAQYYRGRDRTPAGQ